MNASNSEFTEIFENRILKNFKPKFKSIDKDCDRYFDALFQLHEDGVIDRKDVILLNGEGSLWIGFQYIDNGLLDLVEEDIKRDESDKDFHGPLHENSRLLMDRLLEKSERDRVFSIYCTAIRHRLRYLQSDATPEKRKKFYLPALREMIGQYGALLKKLDCDGPEFEEFEKALKDL